MKKHHFTVTKTDAGITLGQWCKTHLPHLSYGLVQKLIRKKDIKLGGKRATLRDTLNTGDEISVYAALEAKAPQAPAPMPSKAQCRDMVDSVLAETPHCIAINKPAGLPVQGGSNVRDNVDFRLEALRGYNDGERPKLVHRLDRDTSGILLLAKSRQDAAALTEAFRARHTKKIYWALVMGVPDEPIGEINLPLGKRLHENIEKMSVLVDDDGGKPALTHYRIVASEHGLSWLELRPVTGRTHQLRVHLNAIGHPIVGDGKYGGKAAFPSGAINLDKQLHLHARYIDISGKQGIRATAPLPEHMARSWHALGFPQRDQGVSLLDVMDHA